jgi:hypothetical protein
VKLSPTMRAVVIAMQNGTQYMYDSAYCGVSIINATTSAPMPSIATMEALERRGLIIERHTTAASKRPAARISGWELTEQGKEFK